MLMQLKPIALLACSALAVAGAANIRTLKPEIGNIFSVYPGWSLLDAVELMCAPSTDIQSVSFNLTELACQQACSTVTLKQFLFGLPRRYKTVLILKSSINIADFTIQSGVVTSVGLIGGCGIFSPAGPTLCQSVTVLPV
ncbi:hypothetical protein DFH08DRAFT_822864 [Mycena albidolilacea]|uniref:Uncharacterized protein n=1 Tax=Mycena albidolilacea TaxID=1033008 RepID=A0AAD6Z7R9_9AGAR|nr:hypothetical protein DFH08DRAFT_822864 [Mycena albidolilacea]